MTKRKKWGADVKISGGVVPELRQLIQRLHDDEMQPKIDDVIWTVTGTVEADGNGILLRLDQMKRSAVFVLLPSKEKEYLANYESLRTSGARDMRTVFEVEGEWIEKSRRLTYDSRPALVLRKYSILEESGGNE